MTKGTASQSSLKVFGIVALVAIALYLANAALLGKLGLFAFFSHSYSLAYQVMFLFVLAIVAFLWIRNSPRDRSLLACGLIGAISGYAISIGCLILAFALFGQVDGVAASMENFVERVSSSPADSLVGFLYAAGVTFGWLYGALVFVSAQMFSLASKAWIDRWFRF